MYIEAVKSYPSQNAKLKTQQGTGMHIKTDIFTGKMWYGFKKPGEPMIMAGFPIDVVREILAKNKEGEIPEVDLQMADEPAPETKQPDYENVTGQDELTRFDNKIKSRSGGGGRGGKRNRDRDRRPASSGQPGAQGGQQRAQGGQRPQQGPRPEGQQGGRNDRRRRGRGRGDRPQGGGATPPAA